MLEFVRALPFFSQVGKIAVIASASNAVAVEHVDHAFDDLVCEMVWLKTASSSKRFYVCDEQTGQRHFAPDGCAPHRTTISVLGCP